MKPVLIKKGRYLGHVHLSALDAWIAGRTPSLLVENRSHAERRFDEARSRYAAEALSGDKPRFGEYREFESRFFHGEA